MEHPWNTPPLNGRNLGTITPRADQKNILLMSSFCCGPASMVRKGSTVRVRQRACGHLQGESASAWVPSARLAQRGRNPGSRQRLDDWPSSSLGHPANRDRSGRQNDGALHGPGDVQVFETVTGGCPAPAVCRDSGITASAVGKSVGKLRSIGAQPRCQETVEPSRRARGDIALSFSCWVAVRPRGPP
jgi:hypothetical protein